MPPSPEASPESPRPQLIVFSDDWGRHPSSCQHLVRHLLDEFDVLWVNTIGMRKPRWGWADLARIVGVVGHWFLPPNRLPEEMFASGGANLTVINPKMYPGFRSGWQRRFNAKRIERAVRQALGKTNVPSPQPSPRGRGGKRVVLTTLPITADLVGRLDADRWVYYCVDDFSVWPGVDHDVMDAMERELVAKVDAVLAVSEVLVERVRGMKHEDTKAPRREGAEPVLLTHGVDVDHWTNVGESIELIGNPSLLFIGLVDERVDADWCDALAISDTVCLNALGLRNESSDPRLWRMVHFYFCGYESYEQLPAYTAAADVLVMPYIDAPVTRAMQPLKLLEYLATMKPVVVRDLPSTRAWADCCDVVDNAQDFVRLCLERAKTGTPPEQVAARNKRLPGESWSEKARRMREILLNSPDNR